MIIMDTTPQNITITCPLYEASLSHTETCALSNNEVRLSYREVHELVNGLCALLKCYSNQTVVLIAHHDERTILALLALLRLNIKVVLQHPKMIVLDHFQVIDPLQLSAIRTTYGPTTWDITCIKVFFLTSGFTGQPKPVSFNLGALLKSALGTNCFYQLDTEMTWLLKLPISHVGGFMVIFRCLLAKATIQLNESAAADFLSYVPTQLYRLLQSPSNEELLRLRSARTILLGGAKTSSSLLEKADSYKLNLSITYGMTEMASQITAGIHSCGHPLPFRDIKIAEDGEILVKGACLFSGYGVEDPKHLILDNEGFFRTRDMGTYSEEQGLTWLGRKDRMITKGGENIYPEEIESLLWQITEINQVAFFGIDDEEWGSELVLMITPFNKTVLKKIDALLEAFVPKFFRPKYSFPYPTQETLKPSYSLLKQEAMRQIALLKQKAVQSSVLYSHLRQHV
jgi:acyl-CoA synthetase (AMP-forming)/AMP-acid ligase II